MTAKLKILFTYVIVLTFLSCTNQQVEVKTVDTNDSIKTSTPCTSPSGPLTVVELFSSESCYDCPAAEDLLNELSKDPKSELICIEQHVDYWNDLIDGEDQCKGNWVDPYSSGLITNRQLSYTKQLNSKAVTPQFIINGHLIVNGADKDSLLYKIKKAKNDTAIYTMCVKPNTALSDVRSNNLTVDFELNTLNNSEFKSKSTQVLIFLIESDIESKPTKGENCGKTLHHQNITRAFNAHTLYGKTKTGSIDLTIPENTDLKNCFLVGYVQNLNTLKIIGCSAKTKL